MARTVTRNTFDPESIFEQHIALKVQADKTKTRAESLKKKLKDWLPSNASYTDDKGNRFFNFARTLKDGFGGTYKGMELRRSVSETFDDEEALKIAQRKGVKITETIEVVSQDMFYAAVQEGKLTARDADKVIVQNESFAFWPVKGEVE